MDKEKANKNYSLSKIDQKLSVDEKALLDELGIFGESRRKFIGQTSAAGLSLLATQFFSVESMLASDANSNINLPLKLINPLDVSFTINGTKENLTVDSRMTLLDTLRERLKLTGSKKGCDHGQCGACTLLVEGDRVLSCLTLAASCEGKEVTSIEGLENENKLHPLQRAFIEHDGFQCGYCTPGQICSSVALMEEAKKGDASYVTEDIRNVSKNLELSDEEIRERMSGNICRCGAYTNILAAIKEVHTGKDTSINWQDSE